MTIVRFSLRVWAATATPNGSCGALKGSRTILPAAMATLVAVPPPSNNTTCVWSKRGYASGPSGAFGRQPEFIRNMTVRSLSSKAAAPGPRIVTNDLTKNLQIISDQKINVEHDPKTLKLKSPLTGRPLAVMLCWLQARQKHVEKYAKLYIDQGIDVLAVQITPWQLLWPTKGTQLVARDVVQFLHANTTYNPLFLHGFSVGGYMWGECLVHMERDLPRFQPVLDRIVGQIFDSAADVSEIHIGIPKAVFPKNPKMQAALRKYIIYHMKTFHEPATSHYIRSSQMFHGNLLRSPALFFVSKKDPVGPPESNDRVRDNWVRNNVEMTYKVFEKSPHVGHFQMYRDEYVAIMMNHLRSVNLIKDTERVRAKL